MKRWMILLLFMTLPAGYALAGEHGRGGGMERAREHRVAERRAERRAERHEVRQHERRRDWARERRANHHRPRGWDHGKKTGWHGADVPPGMTKKHEGHQGRYAHRGVRPVHTATPPVQHSLPAGAQQRIEQRRAAEHARVQPVAH